MKRAWVLRWPRGTKMPGQPLNCGGETSGEHCILGPPCYSSFTYTVTNAASKSPSWLGSSRPQTIGRSALPSSVWSRWHSLFGHREEHVLCRGVTWWGRQTSASLTALPLTGSHRATHWALWAAASAPLNCRWYPLRQDWVEEGVTSSVWKAFLVQCLVNDSYCY